MKFSKENSLILVVGTLLTAFIAYLIYLERKEVLENKFIGAVDIVTVQLKDSLTVNSQILESVKTFIETKPDFNERDFKKFTTPLINSYDYLQALEWIPEILSSESSKYEAMIHKNGNSEFKIWRLPDSKDFKYQYPVFYVNPIGPNKKAHGLDLGSSPARRRSLELAKGSGEIVATAKITLVQESGKESGFLIFNPLFSDSSNRGFILGVYRIETMINRIIGTELENRLLNLPMQGRLKSV